MFCAFWCSFCASPITGMRNAGIFGNRDGIFCTCFSHFCALRGNGCYGKISSKFDSIRRRHPCEKSGRIRRPVFIKERTKSMTGRWLASNAVAHLLVDAVCAAAVVASASAGGFAVFYIYNSFAFSTQCLTGLLTDRCGHCRLLGPLACVWVALCGLLPLHPTVVAVLIGLGNSLFHVAAGSEVLTNSKGHAASLGLFVAPGALGVFAGKAFPQARPVLCIMLILCAVWLFGENRLCGGEYDSRSKTSHAKTRLHLALLLLLAVMTRAVGGAVSGGSGQAALWMSFLVVFCVFAGKSLGGILSDAVGIRRLTIVSVPLAALFILLAGSNFAAVSAGQFLLNLSMPVTLFLIYRCLPDDPGFSFGLAASVLWPGDLIGRCISVSGAVKTVLLLFCFSVSLFAIIFSEREISYEKSSY